MYMHMWACMHVLYWDMCARVYAQRFLTGDVAMSDEGAEEKMCAELMNRIDALSSSPADLLSLLLQDVESFKPSRHALKVSEIGKRMKKLCKSDNAGVSSAALRISNSWRELHGLSLRPGPQQPEACAPVRIEVHSTEADRASTPARISRLLVSGPRGEQQAAPVAMRVHGRGPDCGDSEMIRSMHEHVGGVSAETKCNCSHVRKSIPVSVIPFHIQHATNDI